MDFLPTSGVAKGAAMAAPLAVGMLAGKKAATWDALAAAKAKMLADMGTDARTIWKETGTWKGPDGKWRQEIDGSAPFTPSTNPQAGAMLRDQPANLGVSKVINNFKVPKTLYHGSAEPFESFDPKLLGTNTKSSDAEIGFHFSDNKSDASLYADMAKRQQLRRDEPWLSESDVQFESGVVRPFNLDIKNPLVIGGDEFEGNAGKFTQQFLDDKLAARKYADENGYDGIIYPQGTNVDSGYTVIAFEPSQIKKQVVNQPTNE
jgi:hypothetical protein